MDTTDKQPKELPTEMTLLEAYNAGSDESCVKAQSIREEVSHLRDLIVNQQEGNNHIDTSVTYLLMLIRRELERIRSNLTEYRLRAHDLQDEISGAGFKVLKYADWISLKNYLQDRHIIVSSTGVPAEKLNLSVTEYQKAVSHVREMTGVELQSCWEALGNSDYSGSDYSSYQGVTMDEWASLVQVELKYKLDYPDADLAAKNVRRSAVENGEVSFKPTGVIINGVDRTITLPLRIWDNIKASMEDHHMELHDDGTIVETP